MPEKRVIAAVKAVIQREDGAFLVLEQVHNDITYWDLPGGRIEHGETPYDALARELKEETGLVAPIIKPLGFFWFYRDDGHEVVCATFLCRASPNSLAGLTLTNNPSTAENIREFRWVTKDAFQSEDYFVADASLKKLVRESL